METAYDRQASILNQLRLKWGLFAGICLAFLMAGAIALSITWKLVHALSWSAIAGLTIFYLLAIFWRNLQSNHRQGESQLLPALGWGNQMTLLRGLLTAGLLGFLFSPSPPDGWAWVPGILYTLVCLADFLDGYLARITDHVTHLGKVLDMSFDGLGVLGAVLLSVQYGQLPSWYLLIGMARYLFLGGVWLLQRAGKPVHELPASVRRRGMAGLQMGFLAVMLWPIFSPPGTHIAAALFGLPFLIAFLFDWSQVSGMGAPLQKAAHLKIHTRLRRGLPVAMRVAILGLGAPMLIQRYLSFGFLTPQMQLLTMLESLAILLLVIGAVGRGTAIAALMMLGFHQMIAPLNTTQILLGIAYTGILLLGTGEFSLWAPEDQLIVRRAGERLETSGQLSMEHGT